MPPEGDGRWRPHHPHYCCRRPRFSSAAVDSLALFVPALPAGWRCAVRAACTARKLRVSQGPKAALAAALASIRPGRGHSHAAAPKEISAYDCAVRVTPVLSLGGCSCTVSRICLSEGCTAALCSAGSLFFSPGRDTEGGGGLGNATAGGIGDPSAGDNSHTLDLVCGCSVSRGGVGDECPHLFPLSTLIFLLGLVPFPSFPFLVFLTPGVPYPASPLFLYCLCPKSK